MKKHKKPVAQDLVEEEFVDMLAEETESLSVSDALETSFTGLKKKKEKLAHTDLNDENENVGGDFVDAIGEDEEGDGILCQHYPGKGTVRNNEYAEKHKKPVAQDIVEEEFVDMVAEKTESLSVSDGFEASFTGLKKKNKKTKNVGDDLDDAIEVDEEGDGILHELYPWEGTDRDYEYKELLARFFSIALWKDPDSPTMVMRPAQILEGRKKTVFVNFIDLCNIMRRQPDHVMSFLLAEMRTSGSLDGQQRLVVKGRFGTQKFEVLLRHYIRRYVICSVFKNRDTTYQRRTISSSSNVERYCFPSDLFI